MLLHWFRSPTSFLFCCLGLDGVTAAIVLKGVFQHVNGRAVLADIDLTIEQGEIFALLGANGAGKTLLLRIITGLDTPSAGYVEILGRDLKRINASELSALRHELGMVFQGGALLNDLNVVENLLLPLRSSRMSGKQMQRVARLIMTRLRLDGMENFYPFQLSGGVARMVELARALIHRPALLLWDELLDGLDPAGVQAVVEHLKQEQEIFNMSLLFTSHQVGGAVAMANRIGVLSGGRLLFVGTGKQLDAATPSSLALRYAVTGRAEKKGP